MANHQAPWTSPLMVDLSLYFLEKLDGVGSVNNKPSTDKLHHFVQKKNKKKLHVTCDM